ncbi:phosphoglycerate kinase [Blastochloris sulfoviridis]|uniref:Phosphoglycerate kinase n=1 Tax=Blastochloris sulfoviridis TaxID=50712 RepID=A0A5M6I570_9HYPH|nr:phosphoglycerate kinase [Blastochloris sulfoviridis]KAA5603386.1 phosphoglycerate kinase [Blastochloris sulfoviridis]
MTAFRTLDDADVAGNRVLVRVDLNVPMENGTVSDATRIERVLPTIKEISGKGGKVILLAHFGRPKGVDPTQSLKSIAPAVADKLGKPVAFAPDCIGEAAAAAVAAMKPGDVLLLENTRFHAGEEKNDPEFARALAANGDLWVNDAFSAAHRAHASTEGLGHLLPAYAGRTMQAELDALTKALGAPARPVAAIVGGAKVSTKLDLLGNLSGKVDILIIGGAMANTFLFAEGKAVGKSLCEREMADTARSILATAASRGCTVVLPVDVVAAAEFKANAPSKTVTVDVIGADDMVLDIGPKSVLDVTTRLAAAKTVLWNGPFGAFELEPFDRGTVQVAKAVAELTEAGTVVSVAGGGDTVSALNHAGVAERFTYISTAGGAFLEFLEGKVLPGVEVLRKR